MASSRLDFVLGVHIPSESSLSYLRESHFDHIRAAREAFPSLTAPASCPRRLARCAERMALLGPSGLKEFRQTALDDLRTRSTALRERFDELLSQAPAHAKTILQAAGSL